MKRIGKGAAVLALLLAGLGQTGARADIHAFWDNRCQECHGHAGTFARQFLAVRDGRLEGRHHTADLARFLGQHEMGPERAPAIYAMLLAQAATPPVFQTKCASCHATAAELAREDLEMRDGVLYGRASGKPVAEFLKRHGRATADDIPVLVEALTRVLAETGGARR